MDQNPDQSQQAPNPQPVSSQPVTPPQTLPFSNPFLITITIVLVVAILSSLGTYLVMSVKQNKKPQTTYQQKTTVQTPPVVTSQISPTNTPLPTSSVPSNWKIYKTPIINGLGYELKYPPTWSVQDWGGGGMKPDPLELAKVLQGSGCGSGHPNTDEIVILHMMSANPQQEIATWKDRLKQIDFITSTIITTGDGQSVEKMIAKTLEGTDYSTAIISPQGYYSISARDYCSMGIKEIFDQVISTFRQAK